MKKIKSKLTLITILALSALALLAYLIFTARASLAQLRGQVVRSYEISVEVQKARPLPSRSNAKPGGAKERLLTLARGLNPTERQAELELLLAQEQERGEGWRRTQVEMILQNEQNYRDYLQPLEKFQESLLSYLHILFLFTAAFSATAILLVFRASILGRLNRLAQRMRDFTENRHNYDFAPAPPDEIGELESRFYQLAEKIKAHFSDFQSLDAAKSEFLNIASHELRTPMTSIKGSLSLLSNQIFGALDNESLKLVKIAESETDRLIRLINDLLDLAKIEARKVPLQKKWTTIESVVTKSVEGLRGLEQAAQVQICVDPLPLVELQIDSDRIHQVITNLLSNAIKFSATNSQVRVHCRVGEEGLLLEVSDQGRGIAPQDLERIFQKFRQATTAESPLVKGTGLGLTIAKALIEEHGGTIGVRSRPQVGSTFYFHLPDWRWSTETIECGGAPTPQELAS